MEGYFRQNLKCLQEKEYYYGPQTKEMENMQPSSGCLMQGMTVDWIDLEKIAEYWVPLYINECDVGAISDAEKKSRNKIYPLYLYYEEKEFIYMMINYDMTEIVSTSRIVILVGQEKLLEFFGAQDVTAPTVICNDADGVIRKKIGKICEEKQKTLQQMQSELSAYYKENSDKIRDNILNGTASVCILKYEFEPHKFKRAYQDMKEAFERNGWQVTICNERDSIFATPTVAQVYRYRPDMVIQINKSRHSEVFLGEPVELLDMDDMVYINWMQDIWPGFWNKRYAGSLGERDYIFSTFDSWVLKKYDFAKKNVIYQGIVPADCHSFDIQPVSEEYMEYVCDISFIGSVSSNASVSDFIYTSLLPYFNEQEINRITDGIVTVLESVYDSQTEQYISKPQMLENVLAGLKDELRFHDEVETLVYRVFTVVRYNALRLLILRQLAEQKKYKIILYGDSQPEIEGISYGGKILNPQELSRAIQCSKISIQINSDATMNQRVIECLLSHVPLMVFQVEEQYDMSNLKQYLAEGEGFAYFKTKKELLDKCEQLLHNTQARDELAEKGYQKARERLTTDAVFGYLMDGVREKLRQET
jgi:spore maturation protein CgeB